MRASQIKDEYRKIFYWWRGLYHRAWFSTKTLAKDEKEQQDRMEIERDIHALRAKIDAFFGPKIGEAEMYELRTKA